MFAELSQEAIDSIVGSAVWSVLIVCVTVYAIFRVKNGKDW